MATLGLSTLVQKPPMKMLRSVALAAGADWAAAIAALLPLSPEALENSMRTPIHSR